MSDFVAQRQIEAGMVPPEKVSRVWNALALPPGAALDGRGTLYKLSGIGRDRPLVYCAARAAIPKGVDVLLRAFDQLLARWEPNKPRPFLVYVGDGPELQRFRSSVSQLISSQDVLLAGYHSDAVSLIPDATVCVVPSIWHEAFALTVLEAMLLGKAVIASRTGAIPELIEEGRTGLLVPPGDAPALANGLHWLLCNPKDRSAMGAAAQERANAMFQPERQVRELTRIIRSTFP